MPLRGDGGAGLGPGVGLLAGLLFFVLVAAVVVLLVLLLRRQGTSTGASAAGAPTATAALEATGLDPLARALATAADRYAGGELTKEQYEEIRTTLKT